MPVRLTAFLSGRPRVRDSLPAALVSLLSIPATMAASGNVWHAPRVDGIVWTTAACMPLIWRSARPVTVAVMTLTLECVHLVLTPDGVIVPGASLVAVYTIGARMPRRAAWSAGAAAAVLLATVQMVERGQSVLATSHLVTFDLLLLATAFGDLTRSRRAENAALRERVEQAERTREQEAASRVTEERVRIARDLHDVVAHHITLINAQIGVAGHLVRSDPEAAHQALQGLRDTSRTALEELRATVNLLRQPGDVTTPHRPAPGLTGLDELASTFRQTGLPVEIRSTGTPRPLTASADLAAYRIVQEALTNTRKHAGPAAAARILLEYRETELRLTVHDTGHPAYAATAAGPDHRAGYGLVGMHERAAAAGGTLRAGPAPGRGFKVAAKLPLVAR